MMRKAMVGAHTSCIIPIRITVEAQAVDEFTEIRLQFEWNFGLRL
jgi:hypothetical protein